MTPSFISRFGIGALNIMGYDTRKLDVLKIRANIGFILIVIL